MMLGTNRYQRIGNDDTPNGGTEMTDLVQPSAPVENEATSNPMNLDNRCFCVKVLFKEKSHDICNLSDTSTVGELRIVVEAVTSVPSSLQRLIYAGKQLKPDNKLLSEFKITAGASIHLFPLPAPTQVTPVANAVEVGGGAPATYNPISVSAVAASGQQDVAHRPIHFDPTINQTAREVRLWCMVLMFLSGMTLFNNLSFITATGKLGQGPLDSVVTVIDTVCSAMGIVVANMGIQSLRTMEMSDVSKYVQSLMSLAALSIVLRLMWVVDVILQVQKAVRDSHNGDSTTGGGKDNDTGAVADDPAANQELDGKTTVTIGVQACIIALICIFAWGSCVSRARSLQTAVGNFTNAMHV